MTQPAFVPNTTTTPNPNIVSFKDAYKAKHKSIPTPCRSSRDGNTTYRMDGTPLSQAADPIYDQETMDAIKEYLLTKSGRYGYRNYMIFVAGCNLGRRCGDILKLQVRDVWDAELGQVKSESRYYDQKTKTYKYMYLKDGLRSAIKDYISSLDNPEPETYLFASQKKNCKTGGIMLVSTFWEILHRVKEDLDLHFNFSTHTMRKTAANDFCEVNGINDTCIMLGHKSPAMTMRYLKKKNAQMCEEMNAVPMR